MKTSRRDFFKGTLGAGLANVAARFSRAAGIESGGQALRALGPIVTDWEFRRSKSLSGKKAAMYIDDVIWLFRDLTRQKPKSMFGHPFLGALKEVHAQYGLKLQLNCFYRTDVFYDMDEFSLDDMTEAYKDEWQESKDWLRLGFHAYQEFPDYPFINAGHADMARAFDNVFNAIQRFAGEGVFTRALVAHWLPVSKDGCRTLKERGIRLVACTDGARFAYDGNRNILPYGHAFRVECNRKPETALFRRSAYDPAILSSACSYNHLLSDQADRTCGTFEHVYDRDVGIGFKRFRNGPMLNLCTPAKVKSEMDAAAASELLCIGDHEQYFHKHYFAYQPDYMEKVFLAARMANEAGREFIFVEDTAT